MLPHFESADELREWLVHQRWQSQRFDELLPTIQTADGLVPSHEIALDGSRTWRLKSDQRVSAVPHWRVSTVADYLLEHPLLWDASAIRLERTTPIVGRANVWGVPFQKALEIALTKQIAKSVFWIPVQREKDGQYASLLVRVMRRKDSNGPLVVIESWEWIGEGVEIDYAHMIATPDCKTVLHLDGAIISFDSECEISAIFATGEKHKGRKYEKYFRLDGQFTFFQAIEIIRAFFQIKELVDEYFEHRPAWPAAIEGLA